MNKLVLTIILAAIIVAGAVYGINKGDKTTTNSPNVTTSNSTSATQPKEQTVATDKVNIQNYAFTPATITVKKGTAVTWTNDDTVAHTVNENDGKNGPSAPDLAPGKTYSFTFNNTGTFHYHCALHPDMTGTVTVTD